MALAARLAHVLWVRGTPITDVLLIDSATYDRFARMILAGTFRGEDVYAMNALYPHFLAAIYAVTGGSTLGALVAQSALGALNAGLVFLLGRRLFDGPTAWTAGLVAALYPPAVFYAGTLLTPVLIETFGLLALLALARWQAGGGARLVAAAGVLTGLATLGRGGAILWLPLALGYLRVHAGSWPRALRPWAVFAAGALLMVAAGTARNYLLAGRWVPVSANYAAFYLGHSPEATGLYVLPSFVQTAAFEGEVTGVRVALSRELGRPLTQAEASNELVRRGLRWAASHPREELMLAARKLYYFWNAAESPTNLSFHFAQEFSPLLRLPLGFGVVAPLGLAGMIAARRRWREHLLLHLAVAAPLLTCLAFFVSAEYRMPAVAPLILFAAHAATRAAAALAAWMRPTGARVPEERRSRRAPRTGPRPAIDRSGWLALALLPLFAIGCNVQSRLMRFQRLNRVPFYNAGVLYKDRGDLARAAAMLTRSLAIDPNYAPAHEAMADVERRRGNLAEAARHNAAVGRIDPSRLGLPEDRERVAAEELFQNGRYEEALAAFEPLRARYAERGERASEVAVANNIGLTLHRLRRYDEAERVLREAIAMDPSYVRAHTNLGLVLERQGRLPEAIEEYHRALALEPGNERAQRALSRLAAPR